MADTDQLIQPQDELPPGYGKIVAVLPESMIPVLQSVVNFMTSSRVANPERPVAFCIVASSFPIGNDEDTTDRVALTNSGFTCAWDPTEMGADVLRQHAHGMLNAYVQAEVSFDHEVFRMTQGWAEMLATKGVNVPKVHEQHRSIQIAGVLRNLYETNREGLVNRVSSGKFLCQVLSDGVSCLRDYQIFSAPPLGGGMSDPLNPGELDSQQELSP